MQEVKWKESRYKESLSTALYKLQQADCLCDIWICTRTRMVPVHRLMLEAFTGPLCNTSVKDGTSPISNFIDICSRFDRVIVLILVRYLYTGEVITEVELISEFIKLCKLLDLDSVVLGVETELEFFNKNVKQEVTYHDNNTGFCPGRNLQHAVPVSLITNKNNESETFEDSFIQQNSEFVQEVKKEVTAESVTLIGLNVRNGSSKPCDNDKRGQEMEKNNEIHDETISVDGSIDMEDDNETASPQKRLKFAENNQSLNDNATEKRLYQFVHKMTSDDESNMMEKRICSKCNKILEITKYLKHMKNEHSLFACPLCDWFASQLGHLSDHMHSQHKVVISPKKICSSKTVETSEESELMYITQAEPFQEHTQLNSNKQIDDCIEFGRPTDAVVENKSIQEIYTCKLCKYTTNIKCYYYKHLRKGHTSHTDTINNKRQKLNVDPSIKSEPSSIPKKFLCSSCGKSFKSKYGLTLHDKTIHKKEFKFICNVCGKGFGTLYNFNGHMSSHNNLLREKCDQCDASFQYWKSLLKHKKTRHRTLEEDPKFECDICHVIYGSKDGLREHTHVVHNLKRKTCEYCGKEFKWRSSLAYHLKKCIKNVQNSLMFD